MRNFCWLVENSLAGCAYPRDGAELAELSGLGVSLLVNLHERRHDANLLAQHGLAEVHLPVADFTAPTTEQLAAGVLAIERALAEGRRVAVHCEAGQGRTGTLLACYLVRRGSSPAEAITRVRRARPGSIETPEQEAAVGLYARGLEATRDG